MQILTLTNAAVFLEWLPLTTFLVSTASLFTLYTGTNVTYRLKGMFSFNMYMYVSLLHILVLCHKGIISSDTLEILTLD